MQIIANHCTVVYIKLNRMHKIKTSFGKPLFLFFLLVSLLLNQQIINRGIVFGSWSGGFTYLYTRSPSFLTRLTLMVVIPAAFLLFYTSKKLVSRYEKIVLLLWFVAGSLMQKLIWNLSGLSFHTVLDSNHSNSLFTPIFIYKIREILANYGAIINEFGIHATANMPGKIILFYLLFKLTHNTELIGYLIMGISSLGAILLYFIAKIITGSRKTALYSLLLYFFIPAKIFFLPILNTVTPVFFLLLIFIFIQMIKSKEPGWVVIFVCAVLVLLFFEPLPFMLVPIFIGFGLKEFLAWRNNKFEFIKKILLSTVIFVVLILGIQLTTKFNTASTFLLLLQRAQKFNVLENRHCFIWMRDNLKDLFINSGMLSIVSALLLTVAAFRQFIHDRHLRQPALVLAILIPLNILFLNFTGINCGETIRLWIFTTPLIQLLSAIYLADRNEQLFLLVIASNIVQTILTLSQVSFIQP